MIYKKILLTGASGTLGREIISQNKDKDFLTPSRAELDITKKDNVREFLLKNEFDAVLHCAAMARMKECEENPEKAIETNVIGTSNLVIWTMEKEKKSGKNIRFVHMSTDGVYPGTKGNYKEEDATIPYNTYGWTKLGAECSVRLLKNHCIIRTNFFDPEDIKFDDAATDAFSSKIPIGYLVKAIAILLNNNFIGTINVGRERKSDFDNYRKYKPNLRPCRLKDILKEAKFPMAQDSSMDISKWRKIEQQSL